MMPTDENHDCSSLGPESAMVLPDEEEPLSWDANHVVAWRDADLPTPVYLRTDRSGAFHTYPALSGPFRTIDEVQAAIDLHARGTATEQEERKSVLDKLSQKELAIRESLYYPDGTTKVCTRWQRADQESDKVRRLAEALLDKHNDDVQDRVYKLQDVVHWQSIREGKGQWYYHLNITVKTKGAAGSDDDGGDLFFAEVTRVHEKISGYFISCFCRVKPCDNNDNRGRCHGCINNGSVDMKHPQADLYTGGHKNIRSPLGFGPCNEMKWRDSATDPEEEADEIKATEDRIRNSFNYLDDKEYLERLRSKRLSIL